MAGLRAEEHLGFRSCGEAPHAPRSNGSVAAEEPGRLVRAMQARRFRRPRRGTARATPWGPKARMVGSLTHEDLLAGLSHSPRSAASSIRRARAWYKRPSLARRRDAWPSRGRRHAAPQLLARTRIVESERCMASVTTDKPTETTFEVSGIERVPENERAHTELWDTMWLWWSANSVVATVALGALSFFAGLGFWGSVAGSAAFNALGGLPVAFLSTLGPKTGLAQMPLTRFSFGYQGAKLPAVFNAIACIASSAVNAVIGSSLILASSDNKIPQWAALIFLPLVTTEIGRASCRERV